MIYVQKLNQAFHRDYFNLIFSVKMSSLLLLSYPCGLFEQFIPNISEFTRKKQFEGLAPYKDISGLLWGRRKGRESLLL